MQPCRLGLLGLASFAVLGASSANSRPQQLQPARFFFEPQNRAMLRAVQKGMEREITFNGHFSRSYVSCGLACGTYFFIDRRTGGVVVAPEDSPPSEMTWEVKAKRDSDVIKVTFGPSDGVGPRCSEQHFRLKEHKFVAIDARIPTRCPN